MLVGHNVHQQIKVSRIPSELLYMASFLYKEPGLKKNHPKRSGPFRSVLVQSWSPAQPLKGVNQATKAVA